MLTINPNDTPDAVMRRYVAVYGDEAYQRLSDDEDEVYQVSPDRPCFRGRLLARAHALLHKAEGRDRYGNLPTTERQP
jgi:hypothetical protein